MTYTVTSARRIAAVEERLFSEGENVFAVLDGAAIPDLLDKLHELQPEFACLYRGELEPDIAAVAPYLVRLERGNEFTGWVFREGWESNWGIFAVSDVDFGTLRRHLRRFLTVHDEEGRPLLFRWYDPRVLEVVLPTCNEEQLSTFFGSVRGVTAPLGDCEALTFTFHGALSGRTWSV